MKLTLIRHCEMAGDPFVCPKRPVKGCLSEKNGVPMAEKMAEILKKYKFDLAFSSPYGRALQTAETSLKGRKIPIITLDFLKEWIPNQNLKKMPSTKYESIMKQADNMFAEETWKTDLGEGCFDMYARICPPFLKELDKLGIHSRMGGFVIDKKAKELSIAVFAHGGSLSTLLSFLLEIRPFPLGKLSFGLGAAATVEFRECRGIHYPSLSIPSLTERL